MRIHGIDRLGIEKTKSQARKIFYWLGISNDIESFIKNCEIGLKVYFIVPNIFTYAIKSYCVPFNIYLNPFLYVLDLLIFWNNRLK